MNKNYEPDCAHLRWMVVNTKRKRTWICQDCGTEQHRPFDDTQTPNAYCEGCGALFDCQCVRNERNQSTADTPLRADHPAIIAAQKQGHENGWNAAGSALRDMADELDLNRKEIEHLNRCLNEAGERILDLKFKLRRRKK